MSCLFSGSTPFSTGEEKTEAVTGTSESTRYNIATKLHRDTVPSESSVWRKCGY